MTLIHIVDSDGSCHDVEAEDGQSVMRAARAAGIRGIVAECNGNAACATCHVFFDDAVASTLPAIGVQEDDMLSFTAVDRKPGSRLSCQVEVCPALSGITVRVPDTQV
jgi:2Fe-2S ferredoxin